MHRFLSRFFFALLIGGSHSAFASNTLISLPGGDWLPNWNVYVHLPSDYSANPTTYYPAIIFFPGAGEVGTDASKVIRFGPGAYIQNGWNGEVTVDGQVTKFIVISMQPPSTFYGNMPDVRIRIENLIEMYRIDPNRIHLTGLSNGGWMSNIFATYKPTANDYSYVEFPASVVNVEGVVPSDTYGATPPYPQRFTAYGQHGGKELGFEQTQDFRDIATIINTMNAAVQGSASYFSTNFDGGGHTAWWRFYGGKNYPSTSSYQPETFLIDGVQQTIYQWIARQSRSAAPSTNVAPTANAQSDVSITLPTNTTTLSGQNSIDSDGTIMSYAWAQLSGPTTATIVSPSAVTTSITGLTQPGAYVFRLTVTDDDSATGADTTVVTVNDASVVDECPNILGAQSTVPVGYFQDSVGNCYLVNAAPVANAGPDQAVYIPTNTVTLSGSGTDSDGAIVGYQWAFVSSQSGYAPSLSSSTVPSPTVIGLNQPAYVGTYVYQLTVTDDGGATATDTVTITVVQLTANVGTMIPGLSTYYKMDTDSVDWNTTTAEIRENFNLRHGDAVGSFNTVNTFTGKIGQGLRFASNGYIALGEQPTLFNPTSDFTISLWANFAGINTKGGVSDGTDFISQGEQGKQTRLFFRSDGVLYATVGGQTTQALPGAPKLQLSNKWSHIALVNQNGFQRLYLNGTVVAEGHSGTLTTNSSALFIGASLNAGGNAVNTVSKLYTLDEVRFYSRALSTNELFLLKDAQDNVSPVAYAGSNQTITLPSGATLTGTGADSDGEIASYSWVKKSGATGGAITSPTSATTSVTGLSEGTYVFELTVVDNKGAVGKDELTVVVLPASAGGRPGEMLVPTSAGTLEADLSTENIAPGSTIVIAPGDYYKYITLRGINGTEEKPITIINGNGVVETPTLTIENSKHFILSGSGFSDQYGFRVYGGEEVDAGVAIKDETSDYTIERVAISRVGTGVLLAPEVSDTAAKNYPTHTINDVIVKDTHISDVSDGIVVGAPTATRAPYPARMNNIKVFNNFIHTATGTGIRLTNARDGAEIYDNVVSGFDTGIVLGANTNGNIYNNMLDTGKMGIRFEGYGIQNATGNKLKNITGTSVVAVKGKVSPEVVPTPDIRVFDNTFQKVSSKSKAIDTSGVTLESTITNNLFCSTSSSLTALVSASKGSMITGNQFDTGNCATIVPTPTSLPLSDKAVVTATALNLRTAASTSATILERLGKGSVVTVTGQQEAGWTKVRTVGGTDGYVSTVYLRKTETSIGASSLSSLTTVGKRLRVVPSSLNLRNAPSTTDGRIVAILIKDEIVEVYALSPDGRWYQVRNAKGIVGYASQAYLAELQ